MIRIPDWVVDNTGKIYTGLVALTIAAIGWAMGNKEKKANTSKTEAEAKNILLTMQMKEDKYNSEKEERYQRKIESLTAKLEEIEAKLLQVQKLYNESIVIIEGLKAEKNLFKTITT